jgi:uncharacterized protein with HEPN domain
MPSRSAKTALRDIRHHIDLAMAFIADAGPDELRTDLRTLYAVIRCLEIISEASRRLPDDLKQRHPLIVWKQIAGAGNIYRHDYEDVAADIVWNTVARALPILKAAVDAEIELLS